MLDAAIIGGGQSALATAYYLRKYGVGFVMFGDRAAGAWPTYWDHLTLFSRAEFSNLPGWPMPAYDGYPPRDHVVDYLTRYEQRYDFPVMRERVERVAHRNGTFRLLPQDVEACNVVVATGHVPFVPHLPGTFRGTQIHSADYRNPAQFAGKSVAVVGGGDSGAQITADLALHDVDAQWLTRTPPRFMPDDVDGEALFRRNRERFLAISQGKEDPGGADFGGDIVAVPEVRRARDAGLLKIRHLPSSLDEIEARGVDVLIWATGYRPALGPVRGLDRDTPGLWFVGYNDINGPGAGTLGGVSPFARDVARAIAARN
ncbi:NAD(P)/FAD-dependent oxidoreductase [Corynebacterium imitans]|uniref:NAD(P)-binding domain-containing protein n=1 Tax=Corynebacterium imitans TaxID=156978 RepID=UPI001EF27714|nr:NAD(P)-binding domain-containing protein [Corynebacterium imitans]MCG7277819.1 NAD(P)/FAD-dependent oxidoreductase [Corynebacterium imitans]